MNYVLIVLIVIVLAYMFALKGLYSYCNWYTNAQLGFVPYIIFIAVLITLIYFTYLQYQTTESYNYFKPMWYNYITTKSKRKY